jgi:hypothetical protein
MPGFQQRKIFCQALRRRDKQPCQAKGFLTANGKYLCRFHGYNNIKGFNKPKYTDDKRINQLEARKIGVQTLIDKLLQVFNYQEIENPNQILWIREKTKFVQYLAGKLTDVYSDNKTQKQQIDQTLRVSWQDEPDLVDVNAVEIVDTTNPLPK